MRLTKQRLETKHIARKEYHKTIGHRIDNAPIEGFGGILKSEM